MNIVPQFFTTFVSKTIILPLGLMYHLHFALLNSQVSLPVRSRDSKIQNLFPTENHLHQ